MKKRQKKRGGRKKSNESEKTCLGAMFRAVALEDVDLP